MIYRCLGPEDCEAMYDAFIEAFSDYQVKIQMTKEQFNKMNIRRGLNYELSVGAFDDSNEMVGLLLTGLDVWEGKLTAYDMGTGVIPKYRRRGIGDNMFEFLLPKLQKAGVKQYLLEVITSNEKAYSLYEKKRFKETRKLECFKVSSTKLRTKNIAKKDVAIEEVEAPDWILFEAFWDFKPSWQNSTNSMKRCPKRRTILGAFQEDELRGYAIFYPESGDIPQIAVDKSFRRKKIGTLLMNELAKRAENLSVLNVDDFSKETLLFLRNVGFENFISQYEMMLEL